MKPTIIISTAILLGLLLGLAIAFGRLAVEPWDGDLVSGSLHVELGTKAAPSGAKPKVAVDEVQYNFGAMKFEDEGKHDFIFRNEGNATLVLSEGRRSCQCTRSSIALAEIPPGGSSKVTLEWRAKETAGRYEQSATINTNDATRPEVMLTVSGRITAAVLASPPEIGFGWISADETIARDAKLLCYLSKPLDLEELRKPESFKLADQDTARHFEVTFEPLPTEDLQKADASSGVLMRVTVKPGLPQGPFQQTILLATKLEDAPSIDVAVKGEVGPEIEIRGPRSVWDAKRNLLVLGEVDPKAGAEQRLMVAVRGSHRNEVRLTPTKVEPECLQVAVEDASVAAGSGSGGVVQIPLTIRVRGGAPAAKRLGPDQGGYGEIEIETKHPRVPKLRIAVSFAVGEE
jgi:hypothetical protein